MNLRAGAPVFKPASLAPALAISKNRLLKDLKEIERYPLPLVFALPLESDIWTWHINLIGPEETPYAGGVFHIELKFPQNYPNKNPSAFIYTPLPHPHVHGNRICLDLLSDYDGYFLTASSVADDATRTTASGWSSAYTAYTILLQLQSFLMELDDVDDEALEGYLSRIPDAILKARQFQCSKCPHRGASSPWPPLQALPLEANGGPESARSSPSPPPVVTSELICFHSKRTYEEDILGLPIAVPRGQLRDVTSPLELLSYTSFKEGVRKSVFGETFEYFLPLYINADHGGRSRDVLRRSLASLANRKPDPFDPMCAIEVIPKLMNNIVVSVMDNRMYASVKALVAYCAVHRLLISFIEEYPKLLDYCNEVIHNFIRDDRFRHKSVVSSLGELLALITVSKFTWSDIADAYLQETFARNVLWTMKRTAERRFGDPNGTDPDIESKRVQAFWESNVVSWRLLAFHVYFLEKIARPRGVPLEQVTANYDARLGQPSEQLKAEFQAAIKEIPQRLEQIWNGNNFAEFFKRINRPVPLKDQLDQMTKQAVADAVRKGSVYCTFTDNRPSRGGGRGRKPPNQH